MRLSRTRLLDRAVNVRDAALCVIATEGEKTEAQYFSLFESPSIKVKTLPTQEDHHSAPHHVLNRLEQFKQDHDLGAEDTLWLMIDVDHRRAEELSRICREAVQKGFQLAVSNPCFELWLHLHFADAPASVSRCKEVEASLRQQLGGYRKNHLDLETYRPGITEAIQRARALHTNTNERWPTALGTHVYRVVETLLARM